MGMNIHTGIKYDNNTIGSFKRISIYISLYDRKTMRKIKYDTYENIFTLHSFSTIRDIKLEKIAGDLGRNLVGTKKTAKVILDNAETDNEMFEYFTERSRHTPDVTQLHTKHCMENAIAECTCSNRLRSGVSEEILL